VRQAHARLGALARGCFRVAGTKQETRFKISSRRKAKSRARALFVARSARAPWRRTRASRGSFTC
jgi:hypothetical protein